jgi:hypothetical protein
MKGHLNIEARKSPQNAFGDGLLSGGVSDQGVTVWPDTILGRIITVPLVLFCFNTFQSFYRVIVAMMNQVRTCTIIGSS